MLKSLSPSGIPGALKSAEEFRQLGRPQMCESICLDVLQLDAGNQKAWRLLVLARTDQFGNDASVHAPGAREAQHQLTSEYERAFYDGFILERMAHAAIAQGAARAVWELLTQAMASFEEAERLRPEGNDDAILMWNGCQRLLQTAPHSGPRETQAFETYIGE